VLKDIELLMKTITWFHELKTIEKYLFTEREDNQLVS